MAAVVVEEEERLPEKGVEGSQDKWQDKWLKDYPKVEEQVLILLYILRSSFWSMLVIEQNWWMADIEAVEVKNYKTDKEELVVKVEPLHTNSEGGYGSCE